MLRKILISSAILIASTNTVLANPAPYLGIGTGVVVNTNDNYYRGMPLNLFVGYGGLVTDTFYLGGELFGTVATATLSKGDRDVLAPRNTSYEKSTYAYGASLLPGLALSDHTLAYARVGIIRSRFDVNTYQLAANNVTVNRVNSADTFTGAQLGVGVQTCLTQNVDVRGEYDFTYYRSKDVNGVSLQPRQDAFNINFIYKFD